MSTHKSGPVRAGWRRWPDCAIKSAVPEEVCPVNGVLRRAPCRWPRRPSAPAGPGRGGLRVSGRTGCRGALTCGYAMNAAERTVPAVSPVCAAGVKATPRASRACAVRWWEEGTGRHMVRYRPRWGPAGGSRGSEVWPEVPGCRPRRVRHSGGPSRARRRPAGVAEVPVDVDQVHRPLVPADFGGCGCLVRPFDPAVEDRAVRVADARPYFSATSAPAADAVPAPPFAVTRQPPPAQPPRSAPDDGLSGAARAGTG